MARKGRALERLVELLERCLAPDGAEIKSPDFIPDRVTGRPREVDISIRMNLGSIPVLIIVECRDRGDVEDVLWIEQLATKRDDLNAAKAVAVSTSGFSRSAEDKAKFYGIETRRIDKITSDDIRDWFEGGDMIVYLRKSVIHSVTVDIESNLPDNIEIQIDENIAGHLTKPDLEADVFICKEDGKACSLSTVFLSMPQDGNNDIYRGVPNNGSNIRRTLVMNFPDSRKRYQLPTKSGVLDITRITFVVDLWIERSSIPIKHIYAYMSPETSLVQAVEYEVDIEGKRKIISLHRGSQSGQISIDIRATNSEDTNGG